MNAHLAALDPDGLIAEVLVDEEALQARIAELGAAVTRDYAEADVLLVGVLKGAVFFMADLVRHITVPCEIDFMAVSSYGNATDSSGVVRILKDLDVNIEGRHVLIVEDIIDSGLTLSYLLRSLGAGRPAPPEVWGLVTKTAPGKADIRCRYVGFEIPDRFAIGYGLDYAERLRNLPYVAALDESKLGDEFAE
jgi:hypoxanthine phosphoribosyltransferase